MFHSNTRTKSSFGDQLFKKKGVKADEPVNQFGKKIGRHLKKYIY